MLHKILIDGIYSVADKSTFIMIDLSTILYIGGLLFCSSSKDTLQFRICFKHREDTLNIMGKMGAVREEHGKLVEAWAKFKEK